MARFLYVTPYADCVNFQPAAFHTLTGRPGLAPLSAGTIAPFLPEEEDKMPANTLNDMILGYAVILGILLIYVISPGHPHTYGPISEKKPEKQALS
jgi:hypothetical protein